MIELFVILLLVVVNGLFSMSEIAVVSSRRARLESAAQAGDHGAVLALKLIDNPTPFLSTVQIGVTLVSIVAGAYGGTRIAEQIAPRFESIPLLFGYGTALAFIIVITAITLLSLIFGELIPKRVALAYPEAIAKAMSPMLSAMARMFLPVTRILNFSTEGIIRLFKLAPSAGEEVTEDEIRFMIAQGAESGAIEKGEGEIVHEVLRLGDRPISSLMTPRTELIWLSIDDPVEMNWETVCTASHNYFPVAKNDIDHVIGVVTFRDFARLMKKNEGQNFDKLIRQPLKVPSSSSALKLVEQFRGAENHVALVVDEYGGLDGMITSRDLIEAIIGEPGGVSGIPDTDFIARLDGSYIVDAAMDVDEVFDRLGLGHHQYDHAGYHSFGGFILSQLGRVPREGEAIDVQGFRFEVIDMDKLRIDKILVVPPKETRSGDGRSD